MLNVLELNGGIEKEFEDVNGLVLTAEGEFADGKFGLELCDEDVLNGSLRRVE